MLLIAKYDAKSSKYSLILATEPANWWPIQEVSEEQDCKNLV